MLCFVVAWICIIIFIIYTLYKLQINNITDQNKYNNVSLYFIINIFEKLLPLIDLLNYKIRNEDIYFSIFVFLLYNLYLYYYNHLITDIYGFDAKYTARIEDGNTPILYLINNYITQSCKK